MNHAHYRSFLFGIPFLSYMLTACGGPEAAQLEAASMDLRLLEREAAFRADYQDRYGTYRPWVPRKELDCITADFRGHIHHGTIAMHGSIGTSSSSLTVNVGALREVISNLVCASTDSIKHGVIVRYGVDTNDEFNAVLQVVCLEFYAADSTYDYQDTPDCYRINGDGSLSFKQDGVADWMKTNNGGRNYWSEVVIQHDGDGPWAVFDSTSDVRMTIFPYETTLTHLIDHNSTVDHPLEKLLLEPISVPEQRIATGNGYDERGFFNGVCWKPVGVEVDDNTYMGYPYKAKAADLGSPCPPNCPMYRFKFRKTGITPRAACMPGS